jgi:hypothetical protein
MCDSADIYCNNFKPGDGFLYELYSANAALPGPLSRLQQPRSAVVANPIRDLFLQNEFLNYAHPLFAEMKGAPILPGHQTWGSDANLLPSDLLTRPVSLRENCSCMKKKD